MSVPLSSFSSALPRAWLAPDIASLAIALADALIAGIAGVLQVVVVVLPLGVPVVVVAFWQPASDMQRPTATIATKPARRSAG